MNRNVKLTEHNENEVGADGEQQADGHQPGRRTPQTLEAPLQSWRSRISLFKLSSDHPTCEVY